MIYFDLHCDTATLMYDHNLKFNASELHVNSRGFKRFEKCYQCFAVFIDDVKSVHGLDYFKNVVSYFQPLAAGEKNLVPVLTTEGGRVIDGNPDNLNILKDYNVRIFGMVWNGENPLATGAAKDNTKGLTALGKECLKRLSDLSIYPDISHLSDQGVYDLMENYDKPFVATHSNCRAVRNHFRNQTDEQLKEIYRRGGLTGLNLYPPTISEQPSIAGLMDHVEHMLELGGENSVCLGCDWDGTSLPDGITGIESIFDIYTELKKYYGEVIADKIIYKNALRFLDLKA
jgi:membrane dipeptidase